MEKEYMSIKRELVAPLNLRLWWIMRGRRMTMTLAG
jgi:hypothetical protein